MTYPAVTERRVDLQPVEHDPFIDGLRRDDDKVAAAPVAPAPRYLVKPSSRR